MFISYLLLGDIRMAKTTSIANGKNYFGFEDFAISTFAREEKASPSAKVNLNRYGGFSDFRVTNPFGKM